MFANDHLREALAKIRALSEARPDCEEARAALKLCDDAMSEQRQREEDAKQARIDIKAIWGIG